MNTSHSKSKWQVVWAHPSDEESLRSLFAKAFGYEMSAKQWRWKYARSDPWGSMVRSNHHVVAFYGGMPRRIRFFGVDATAVQIGDVMVDPSEGRALTRHGPFFLAASSYLEHFAGSDKAYRLAFGFPTSRVNRLAERLGLYANIGKMLEARWSVDSFKSHRLLSVCEYSTQEADLLDELWQQMANDFPEVIMPVRDSSHVAYRFLSHPVNDYKVYLVKHRITRRPYGLVVLKDHMDSGIELLDIVGTRNRLKNLVDVACHLTNSMHRPKLFSWVSEPVALALEKTKPQLHDLDITLPTNIWKENSDINCLRGKWWLMGGDTDFR